MMTTTDFLRLPKQFYGCINGHRWVMFAADVPDRVPCPWCMQGGAPVEYHSGEVESLKVSSVNPLAVGGETACEHLKNAQQIGSGLVELFERKDLGALAADVKAILGRIERAREEIGKGNIGR